jgi:hypothetical protein
VMGAGGCRSGRHPVPILGSGASGEAVGRAVQVSADGQALSFGVASCHGKPKATVTETTADVRIKVIASTSFGGKCADFVTVRLSSPLGHRHVRDLVSRHEVQVTP